MPLLLVLSIEAFCIGVPLSLFLERNALRALAPGPNYLARVHVRLVFAAWCLGYLVLPLMVSLVPFLPQILGAGREQSAWWEVIFGGWVIDAFPKDVAWFRFALQALILTIEMLGSSLLVFQVRTATLRAPPGNDEMAEKILYKRKQATRYGLISATSLVMGFYWLSVVLEGVQRLRGSMRFN